MTRWALQARGFFIGALLAAFMGGTPPAAGQSGGAMAGSDIAPLAHPSVGGMTGEILFEKLLEHNRLRETNLQQYLVARTYRVENDKGKVRAQAQVLLQYRAPATKEFKVISEKGSGIVRRRVFMPLLESEVETASGHNRHDSSITPANYTFELLGEEDMDGYTCFVVQAIPRRKAKYLFEAKIWIEANDFAIVKIEGQPAKNPSFWTKRVDFVRRYQKVGEFWFPLKDESVTQVRIFGKHIFTIDYDSYEINKTEGMGTYPIADSGRQPRNTIAQLFWSLPEIDAPFFPRSMQS